MSLQDISTSLTSAEILRTKDLGGKSDFLGFQIIPYRMCQLSILGGTMSNSVVDATEIGSNNYIARLFRQITFEMSGFTKERSYGVKSARLSC